MKFLEEMLAMTYGGSLGESSIKDWRGVYEEETSEPSRVKV